ncbi:MAG: hypothetical protein ABI600_13215 [Luteolibacter sp.]
MKPLHFYLGLLVLSVNACKQDKEIKVYRVVREDPATSQQAPSADPQAGMMPGGVMPGAAGDPHAGLSADQLAATGASNGPNIMDSPPAQWKKQAPSSMRQLSYLIEGEGGASTDISLVILRGAAGGNLGNVNRWRGQLGQPAIDDAALKQSSQTLITPVGEALVVEIEGLAAGADAQKDGRLIGVIADKSGDAWFYKMRGNSAITAAEKANFMQWVQTVKPAADGTTTAHAVPPAATPPLAAAGSGDGSLTWQIPAEWTIAPATSSMRYATFNVIAADGSKGEMSVTHFPGDVGGDLENVNRWRQQVALAPVDPAGLSSLVSKLTAGPKTLSLIDVTGPQKRLVAGWTRHGKDTWFFKFTGPDALVAAEKAKFTAFLESVRFTKPE